MIFNLYPSNPKPNSTQFCVEDRYSAGILSHPSFPPDAEIQARRYKFVPPPIPLNIFINHFLTTKNPHRRTTWLRRLPQKLDASIHIQRGQNADGIVEGWGIHIVEGPNGLAIFWTSVLIATTTVAASAIYWGATGDGQTATGLGALISATWAIMMPAFYLKRTCE